MRFDPLRSLLAALDAGADRAHARHPQRPNRWQRWRSRRQLRELDDRQLADIGLTRAKVERETRLAFWR